MRAFLKRVGRFFAELRRRRVYQVAAAYLVLAFAGLEALDILVPLTRLPDGSTVFFLGLAIVGFPIALVFAWIFDLTPSGVERTPEAGSVSPESPAPGKKDPDPGDGTTTLSGTATPFGEGELDPMTVAVLPFEKLSGGPAAEPLVVGLHDDLVVELSRASALRVISGTSVRAYRGRGHTVGETGRTLGAGTVVMGTVQSSGNRVRLNIQMVDARTESNRWAERYDRELTAENLFDLQAELAARIRGELRARLTRDEEARTRRQPTDDLGAYRLYVQGRRRLEEWSEASIRGAARDFLAALDTDPEYALAWSGLADACSLLDWYNYPPEEGAPGAMEAADRALELDPHLAEAHASRAIVRVSPRIQDAPGARADLERALELRPSYAYAYIWLGWVHLLLGDGASAVKAEVEGVRLDPLSPAARVFLAEALLADGRAEEALVEILRGRELQPARPLTHLFEGLIRHHLQDHQGALQAFQAMEERLRPGTSSPTAAEARAFQAPTRAAHGDTDAVRGLLDDEAVAGDAFCRGLVRASLGDATGAVADFQEVDRWTQLGTESIRFFFPDVLGAVRRDPAWPGLKRAVDRSWRAG